MTEMNVEDNPKGIPLLKERWPCIVGERHTFAPNQLVCLCGRLSKGVPNEHPFVTLMHATGEKE